MNTINPRTVFTNTLAAGVMTLCVTAQASEFSGETTITRAQYTVEKAVNYEDLDLSSDKGREALEGRVMQAAREVCGSTDYRMTGSLQVASRNRSCVAEAFGDAMSRIAGPTVVAVRD